MLSYTANAYANDKLVFADNRRSRYQNKRDSHNYYEMSVPYMFYLMGVIDYQII